MTTDQAIQASRQQRAQKILAAPFDYKICEGCDSIVAQRVTECPSCHSYRFDCRLRHVKAKARELAAKLPETPDWTQ